MANGRNSLFAPSQSLGAGAGRRAAQAPPSPAKRGRAVEWNAVGGSRRLLLAAADLERLTLILHLIDRGEHLLVQFLIGTPHDLVQVFVHDDVARLRIDLDRPLRAVELPALKRLNRRLAVQLAIGGVNG